MTSVPRFRHGSRVPGWDEAVDLDRPPAEVPDPATTEVPGDLRAEIEGYMAKYPDRRSAAIPALYEAVCRAAEGNAEVNVRAFECLGACDIAPMASVDGTYVGPLEPADAQRILDDLAAGRPVLEDKQLLRRPVADRSANTRDFAMSAGAGMPGDAAGPSAPFHDEEHPPEPDHRQGTTP